VVHVISLLEEELPKYINDVKSKHSENAKAFAFSSFIQKIFDIKTEDLDLEVPVKTAVMQLRGRIDAVFGSLIIEFKKDIRKSLEEAEEELVKYFQAYREKFHDTNYLGIVNDGIRFRVYHPLYENDIVRRVETIDKIDLELSSAEEVFLWFDAYLFTSEKIIPTSKDLKKRFGLESPTFATISRHLEDLFRKVSDYKPVNIKYEGWARYLEIVYGDKPNELKLFFKHTYLSTLVKLLLHLKLSSNSVTKIDEIVSILYGNTFSQRGILNFIEEDFFTWTMFIAIRKQSSKIFHSLLRQLDVYDLEKIDEDVLKELYQELVDPETRKQLGEFYTPDWLAEEIVQEILKNNPSQSVMDPSCGSGTFLFKTIRYKIDALLKNGIEKWNILQHILENVIGFDVHPLAALIAKTNYLLALKDLLNSRKGSISIPVFLSDSLKIPTKTIDVSTTITLFEFEALDTKFIFPASIASDFSKMDDVVEKMKIHGLDFESKVADATKFKDPGVVDQAYNNLISSFERSISNIRNEEERKIIVQNTKTLFDLIKKDSNSIWAYVIRNMYKPISISHKKVDVIIGNPPWLGLNNMKNDEYQDYLKSRSKNYLLVDIKKTQNISNLNLAPLFFCQCADQYLSNHGKIAFVMPQSVLVASQHVNFLNFEKPQVKLNMVYDLENVSPLFRIPSCVLFATKGMPTKYPVDSYIISGKLDSSNAQLVEAKPLLDFKKSKYSPAKRTNEHAYYYDKFSQGAQIIPRSFWFIDIQSDGFLGFNPQNPLVKSSENKDAKPPWDKTRVQGNVERQFVFTSILSKDVVPFGYLRRRLVVLPVLVKGGNIVLIADSKQNEISGLSFSKYLSEAEELWSKYAPAKSKKNMTIYDRVDYQKDLSEQNPNKGFKVLYVKSATYMTSCVVDQEEKYVVPVGNNNFEVHGFFAEGTTYFYNTESKDEAYYLSAILNSKILDKKIKPLQSRGSFGERDIHKLPLSFNIPKYNADLKLHKELAELGFICHQKVKKIIPSLSLKSTGMIRSSIRESLESEFVQIDKNTDKILNVK